MTPWLQDQDLTVWCGDALDVLRGMADGSVDCVVTSPPYWGLRDYGTGDWDGGDPDCDHQGDERWYTESTAATSSAGAFSEPGEANKERLKKGRWREAGKCVTCGAQRVDRQLGLEPTPDQYVTRMVEVFREVRRVLASYGTCWVNLGDSYAGGGYSNHDGTGGAQREDGGKQRHTASATLGLKPKDLVGIPWRVAFALQADGWWLRSDIVWSKSNPMPESVTDRPTKAHEYVFLLTKGPRYFFDQEAVREPAEWARWGDQTNRKHEGSGSAAGWIGDKPKEELQRRKTPTWEERKAAGATRGNVAFNGNVGAGTQRGVHGEGVSHDLGDPARGRNVRSVWEIPTQPYPEAHFATFPEELARRCIVAGCPAEVCGVCGKPRERIVVATGADNNRNREDVGDWIKHKGGNADGKRSLSGATYKPQRAATGGWSDCGHHAYRPGVVLDPFGGSGTVAAVARKHGRRAVLIELNEQYCQLIARRTQQQSLFA